MPKAKIKKAPPVKESPSPRSPRKKAASVPAPTAKKGRTGQEGGLVSKVYGSTHARAWVPAFLSALGITANVTGSARAANISRQEAYELRRNNATFAKDWDDAIEQAIDVLEEEATRRAKDGVESFVISKGEIVYYQGQPLKKREYSDTLMITLLKAHRPAKYRENIKQEHSGPDGSPLQIQPYILQIPDNGRGDA